MSVELWKIHLEQESLEWKRDLCESLQHRLSFREADEWLEVVEQNCLYEFSLVDNQSEKIIALTPLEIYGKYRDREVDVESGESILLFCAQNDRITLSCKAPSTPESRITAMVRVVTVADDEAQRKFVLPLRSRKQSQVILKNNTSVRMLMLPSNHVITAADFNVNFQSIRVANQNEILQLYPFQAVEVEAKLPKTKAKTNNSVKIIIAPTAQLLSSGLEPELVARSNEESTNVFSSPTVPEEEYVRSNRTLSINTEEEWKSCCKAEEATWSRDLCGSGTPMPLVNRQDEQWKIGEANSLFVFYMRPSEGMVIRRCQFNKRTRARLADVYPGQIYLLFCCEEDELSIKCWSSNSQVNSFKTAVVRVITVVNDDAQKHFVIPMRTNRPTTIVLKNNSSVRSLLLPEDHKISPNNFSVDFTPKRLWVTQSVHYGFIFEACEFCADLLDRSESRYESVYVDFVSSSGHCSTQESGSHMHKPIPRGVNKRGKDTSGVVQKKRKSTVEMSPMEPASSAKTETTAFNIQPQVNNDPIVDLRTSNISQFNQPTNVSHQSLLISDVRDPDEFLTTLDSSNVLPAPHFASSDSFSELQYGVKQVSRNNLTPAKPIATTLRKNTTTSGNWYRSEFFGTTESVISQSMSPMNFRRSDNLSNPIATTSRLPASIPGSQYRNNFLGSRDFITSGVESEADLNESNNISSHRNNAMNKKQK